MISKELEKGISIGSAYGWGAGLGGVNRLSPKAAGIMNFAGAVGGVLAALAAPPGWNDMAEGFACASGGILGLAMTAPAETARLIRAKGEGSKNLDRVERLMLKAGATAKDMGVRAAAPVAAVAAGE